MTNHVHLLLTSNSAAGPGELMKRLGQRYVQYVNRSYQRSGTLWEGRYRSCLAQEENYVLACYRYIELNPVRAGLVEHPADYKWSSYRANGQGHSDGLVQAHAVYTALGKSALSRRSAYRKLFRDQLDTGMMDQIRNATNGNYALGNERFASEIAATLGRRVTRAAPGRPKKRSGVAPDQSD